MNLVKECAIFFINEGTKIKRTPIIFLIFIAPWLLSFGIILFVHSDKSSFFQDTVSTWVLILSIISPLLIGYISSVSGEQEFEAGNFQNLKKERQSAHFFIKNLFFLLVLVVFLLISTISLALGLFFKVGISQEELVRLLILLISLVIAFSFMIPLHFFLSFRLGFGASLGIGILEMILVSYFATLIALFERYWYFLPWTWGIKISLDIIKNWHDCLNDCLLQAIIFLALLIVSTIWFKNWNVKRE